MCKTVLDLAGIDVTVPEHSIYTNRLIDLNDEIGGGINILTVPDSVKTDELIAQVAHHQLSYTVSDDVTARLNKTYFGNIDYSLAISFPQRSAWVVSQNSPELLHRINEWVVELNKQPSFQSIYYKYFEKSKYFESVGFAPIPVPGKISSFDYLFKQEAEKIGWDWRLLAAVAYKESKFNPEAVSWAGACGLMQLMPNTAASLNLSSEEIFLPQRNVAVAVDYLKSLEKLFPGIEDREERIKFVLASYNAGPGHIFDARALAVKYQKDMNVWDDVKEFLLKKSEPAFYSDSVCKYGYCRGKEPVTYVDIIMDKYADYKLWAK
jgi:membrane-bound lytic murein transglycosylase F